MAARKLAYYPTPPEIQKLIENINRRLARVEAAEIAAANRFTVVFEHSSGAWGARIVGLSGYIAAGASLEETAAIIVDKLSEHMLKRQGMTV